MHVAQFWDGRAADVEEQAKGPILAGKEMGMPSAEAVVKKAQGELKNTRLYLPKHFLGTKMRSLTIMWAKPSVLLSANLQRLLSLMLFLEAKPTL